MLFSLSGCSAWDSVVPDRNTGLLRRTGKLYSSGRLESFDSTLDACLLFNEVCNGSGTDEGPN
jgi:hypothetical protein